MLVSTKLTSWQEVNLALLVATNSLCVCVCVCVHTGQPQSFNFTVRPVTGYPVDLYFLVDFSASLKPFIATMKNLSRELGRDSALMGMTDITLNP